MSLPCRRFQQSRFERQNGLAIGTGSFREQNHKHAAVEDDFHFIHQLPDMGSLFSLNEERPREA